MATLDRETLEAALVGFEQQRKQIEGKIEQLRTQLNGSVATASTTRVKSKRAFSAETRCKMAASQQKRWAAKHATGVEPAQEPPEAVSQPKANSKKAKKPSRLSPEARARIAEGQRKRWAAAKKIAKKNG
jgi:hypothetical protein